MENLLPELPMIDLRTRATDKELMDDFSLPLDEVVPVLVGLEQMNAWFGGHKTIIKALKKLGITNGWLVSDWGCGGGDSLRAVAQWASGKGIDLELMGIDATPSAVAFARQTARDYTNINFTEADVLKADFENNQFDVVYSSLFTHHFTDDEWVYLVKKMYACSRKAVIITDLHRHWLLYYAVMALTRLLTNNKMARFDGPLSVRRSFKKAELVELLKKCGIGNYQITWRWAFRWEVVILR